MISSENQWANSQPWWKDTTAVWKRLQHWENATTLVCKNYSIQYFMKSDYCSVKNADFSIKIPSALWEVSFSIEKCPLLYQKCPILYKKGPLLNENAHFTIKMPNTLQKRSTSQQKCTLPVHYKNAQYSTKKVHFSTKMHTTLYKQFKHAQYSVNDAHTILANMEPTGKEVLKPSCGSQNGETFNAHSTQRSCRMLQKIYHFPAGFLIRHCERCK